MQPTASRWVQPGQDRWLTGPAGRSAAPWRLLCIPHAGGGASAFRPWEAFTGPDVELLVAQLPGRESRFPEPALDRVAPVVDGLATALGRLAPKPTLIFGHSMGAMIGYELAARLVGEASPHAPRTLIVSGRTAPGSSSTLGDLLGLDDAGFADALAARYDGIPAALLADRELMAVFLPTLRADFRMVAGYRPDPAACPRLPCPILALGGADDIHAAPERLTAWQDFTTAGFMREIFPGGHFYLAADPARVVARVLAGRSMV
ncbi:thioesterase II family protein [uncultured Tistrella sp.]|uniref:thioesterase II family protein n=1 Tax=Tistrella mobilis TaxID=171437 RepID=UPI002619CAD4|nr:alpha/beta fold hydrolase [uncultured Tistrella sp.]